MLDLTGIGALQELRAQFEQSAAPGEYPATCAGQLMLLADVCAVLGLGEPETRQVIGEPAYGYLAYLASGERTEPAELIGDEGGGL